jgi:hypothetical protein
LVLALAGCNVFGAATPTSAPSPATATVTVTGPTAVASEVPPATTAPDSSAVPASATVPPAASETPAVSPTPVPTVDLAGVEAIQILEPGLSSQVTSPVRVSGISEPTFEQNLVIQVTDQNGDVLSTTPTTILSGAGLAGPYTQEVTFSVTEEQPGRISVYHASARDGGLEHLTSVEVTLLPSGSATINPVLPYGEVHRIDVPAPLAEVSGGTLHIEGFSEYVFEATLVLALCGEGGSGAPDPICGTADNIISTGLALISSPDIGQPGPYSADLAYTISAPVQARLVVYSTSARDGGLIHLSTQPVNLQP